MAKSVCCPCIGPDLSSGWQVATKLAELRNQVALLKTSVGGEVSKGLAELSHQVEVAQLKIQQQGAALAHSASGASRATLELNQWQAEASKVPLSRITVGPNLCG